MEARPAVLYGLETVALTKRLQAELLNMLRFVLKVNRLNTIKNEHIKGAAQVGQFGDKDREVRLHCFLHVQGRDANHTGKKLLRMELLGK